MPSLGSLARCHSVSHLKRFFGFEFFWREMVNRKTHSRMLIFRPSSGQRSLTHTSDTLQLKKKRFSFSQKKFNQKIFFEMSNNVDRIRHRIHDDLVSSSRMLIFNEDKHLQNEYNQKNGRERLNHLHASVRYFWIRLL